MHLFMMWLYLENESFSDSEWANEDIILLNIATQWGHQFGTGCHTVHIPLSWHLIQIEKIDFLFLYFEDEKKGEKFIPLTLQFLCKAEYSSM